MQMFRGGEADTASPPSFATQLHAGVQRILWRSSYLPDRQEREARPVLEEAAAPWWGAVA